MNIPTVEEVPTPLDPEHLTSDQIEAIIHLRVCPPACIRSLTCERQLRYLQKLQNAAIAKLEADPKIEERAIPKRNPDGTLARDKKTGRIVYEVERVPVAEREVEHYEGMLAQVRATYAAQLKVGPEARAARQDAEDRYLTNQFGGKDEQKVVPIAVKAKAIENFRRTRGWL
jgi:hypothetical protein